MNEITEIIKCFNEFDRSRSNSVLFRDWCKLQAISISNQVWHIDKSEEEYMRIAGQYKKKELEKFCEMNALLCMAFEKEINDYLGQIYMELEMGNKQTGQFFTPFHLAELTAKMSLKNQLHHFRENDVIKMNEPASGGGALILATAKALKEKGVNYQSRLDVTAQDLDWNGVYMTYIQLSLCGISARVIQGDALTHEKKDSSQVFYTPMYVLKRGEKF